MNKEKIRVTQAQYVRGYAHGSGGTTPGGIHVTMAREAGGQYPEFYLDGYEDGASKRRRGLEDQPAQHVGTLTRQIGESDAEWESRQAETARERDEDRELLRQYRAAVAATAGDVDAVIRSVPEAAQRMIDSL